MRFLFRWQHLLPILILGFASGLPLALTSSTLQAWYTQSGVSLAAIGALSLVGMPYVYKPIWAPLFDRFQLPLLGRRRGWLFVIQAACVVLLVWMSFLNPQAHPMLMALVACSVAFVSASQDIVYDGYRTDLLEPDERSMGAACVTAGYRFAMLVSGGLAFILADHMGWRVTYWSMAGLMLLCMVVTWFSPEAPLRGRAPLTAREAVVAPLMQFMRRPMAWMLIAFIILYKLGDAFALSMGMSFLLRGMHFSLSDIGVIYKSVGMAATLIGAFVGGYWQPRVGLYRGLWLFGILQALSNAMFLILFFSGKNYAVLVATILIENFCGGLGSAVFVALLTSLCDQRYSATQYALLSALAAIGRVFVGPVAGGVVAYGWVVFFSWSIIVSVPGLFMLWCIRHHHVFTDGDTTELPQETAAL
jgi:PAT family beta-lactamase induction signal transducer AmpG